MAFFKAKNVSIKGVAASVPLSVKENCDYGGEHGINVEKLIQTIGVERRHVADAATCTSDLCLAAAEKLIAGLKWHKGDIDGLILVTQTPDYILPATSPILQDRLGLSKDCFTLDISLGCSGYVYGLSTLAGYIQSGMIKKGLLLAGDTITKLCSPNDKTTYPLFGDAGTATALEYEPGTGGIDFHLGSDGSGFNSILVKDGGSRYPAGKASLEQQSLAEGISSNALQLKLEGMDVFSFGISQAPQSVRELSDRFAIPLNDINYFFFHQANKLMNEHIRKKLGLDPGKVPGSLKDFGNTSSASIPLTMVTESAEALKTTLNKILGCGFGVGLSWGSFSCVTNNLVIPELIKI